MGNSVTGGSLETQTMDYFDRLPRTVRAAVANARFDWSLRFWLRRFEAGGISAKDLAAWFERNDAERAAKERAEIWGTDYPRLKGELPAPRQKKQQRRRKP